MAWCHQAPSHYLKQCWLLIHGFLWHSPESNFSGNAQEINRWNEFEYYTLGILATCPRDQWDNKTILGAWKFQMKNEFPMSLLNAVRRSSCFQYTGWIKKNEITLQCHHNNLTVCSKACSGCQLNIKTLHYWPFVREIHLWLVDSLHKEPVMQKTFPCHVIIMK